MAEKLTLQSKNNFNTYKMMKLVFRTVVLALLALTASTSVFAADYVRVSEKDGKNTYFALSDKPEVTFEGNFLVLKTERETVRYPLSDMLTFEFSNHATGINATGEGEGNVVFTLGETVRGEGLKPGSRVSVYSAGGVTIGSSLADNNGSVEIPLNGQTGVFIVKSLTKTFKFIRK